MSEVETGLSTGQEILIAKACESIWDGIAHDIPVDQVNAKTMVEWTVGRLETFEFKQEREFFEKMMSVVSYEDAVKRVADRCMYDGYEGGGSVK